ncbi:MAG: hypothetical protein V3T86_18125 [Planctomycetota bacterium]
MGTRITTPALLLLALAALDIAARADDAGAETPKTNEHFRLGLRSKMSEQPERAAYHFRVVLDRQPEHRAARRALGYRRTRASQGQPDHRSNAVRRWASNPSRWVRQPSERARAKEALRRTLHEEAAERMRGRFLVLALERAERRRALTLLLRNPNADMRTHAVRDLAKDAGRHAVAPLMHHLAKLHSNSADGGQYISQNRQTAYVQDFDVEIA